MGISFVFGPLTEPECTFSDRYREPNNEITRAWVMGRDTRDFGAKSGESGHGRPSVDVSRDTGGEREPRPA